LVADSGAVLKEVVLLASEAADLIVGSPVELSAAA
jgi:hypothetical protein